MYWLVLLLCFDIIRSVFDLYPDAVYTWYDCNYWY